MNHKFRATIASLLLTTMAPATGLSTAGCSTWISNFKKDPVGQIQNVVQIVQTIISVGTLVFGQVKQTLPADKQSQAQADWDSAVLRANAAVAALQAAVKLAVDKNDPNPDLSKLMADLMMAINALQVLVGNYQTSGTGPGKFGASNPPKGYDVFVSQISLLKGQTGMASASTK